MTAAATPTGHPFVFDLIHSAGRFDESPEAFRAAVGTYMSLCQALAVTEVDRNERARVLRRPGWQAIWGDKGPRDDCGITVLEVKFKVLHAETHTLSHARYINERGELADTTEAAFMVVQDTSSGELLLLGEVHTDHGMGPELRSGHIRSDVARAYVGITRGYLKRARQLMRRFKVDLAALSGDWNLNYRLPWVRAWFKRSWPKGWSMSWDAGQLPTRGTHGREIIDGTLLYGLQVVGVPHILARDPHDDHTAVAMRLRRAA